MVLRGVDSEERSREVGRGVEIEEGRIDGVGRGRERERTGI